MTDVNVFVHQSDILHIFGVSESGLPLTSMKRWLSFQIIQFCEGTRMNLGIAVYPHNSIRDFTHRRYDLESPYVESVWLQVKTGRGHPFLIAFIYRSHSSTLVWFDEFAVMMDRVQNSKHHNEILLLGDFNIDMLKPNPAWVSTLSLFNLHQCVQSPTRVTSTASTLIDHIYVSNPDRLIRTHVPITSMSNHYPVCCTLSCQIPKVKAGKHTTVTYFDAGTFLCDLSNTSFDAIYGLGDADEALDHFYKLFLLKLLVYDKHVPVRRQRVKNMSLPPWLTTDIRQAMKQRDRFKKEKNYPEFKKQRRHVKYLA